MTKIYVLNNKLAFEIDGFPVVFPYTFEFDNDIFKIIPLGALGEEVIVKAHQITDENGKFHPVEKIYALISQFAGAVTGTDSNFANTDLTFVNNRTHDLSGFVLQLKNGEFLFQQTSTSFIKMSAGRISINSINLFFQNIPTFANEAAAITGGLISNCVYKTPTGELRIKL